MTNPSLNLKTSTLTILFVTLLTCSINWLNLNDIPLGYARYENYGFSFLYSKLMNTREAGIPNIGLGSNPSDFAGIVQFQSYWENKLDIFEIIWLVKNRAPNVQAEFDEFFAGQSQTDNPVRRVGESFSAIFHGEEVECFYLEAEEAEYTFFGVLGVIYRPWSSPGSTRVNLVVYITLKGSATDEQVRACFQDYLDNLSI